jgi:hypothetical protein
MGEAQPKAATTYSNIRRYYKKSAEVIVSRKRAVCCKPVKTEVSQKDEGRNVRRERTIKEIIEAKKKRKHLRELLRVCCLSAKPLLTVSFG